MHCQVIIGYLSAGTFSVAFRSDLYTIITPPRLVMATIDVRHPGFSLLSMFTVSHYHASAIPLADINARHHRLEPPWPPRPLPFHVLGLYLPLALKRCPITSRPIFLHICGCRSQPFVTRVSFWHVCSTYADGGFYEGEFAADCLCGEGVMDYADGSRYVQGHAWAGSISCVITYMCR